MSPAHSDGRAGVRQLACEPADSDGPKTCIYCYRLSPKTPQRINSFHVRAAANQSLAARTRGRLRRTCSRTPSAPAGAALSLARVQPRIARLCRRCPRHVPSAPSLRRARSRKSRPPLLNAIRAFPLYYRGIPSQNPPPLPPDSGKSAGGEGGGGSNSVTGQTPDFQNFQKSDFSILKKKRAPRAKSNILR